MSDIMDDVSRGWSEMTWSQRLRLLAVTPLAPFVVFGWCPDWLMDWILDGSRGRTSNE